MVYHRALKASAPSPITPIGRSPPPGASGITPPWPPG